MLTSDLELSPFISELSSLCNVKKALSYLIVLSCFGTVSWAQTEEPHKLDFQDSVRVALENTKAIDASSVAASFGGIWINLGPDQQSMIKKQAKMMKKKGYRVQPHFVNYYGAIVAAVNVEKMEATHFSDFLRVVGKAVEKNNSNQVNLFLHQARDFF